MGKDKNVSPKIFSARSTKPGISGLMNIDEQAKIVHRQRADNVQLIGSARVLRDRPRLFARNILVRFVGNFDDQAR